MNTPSQPKALTPRRTYVLISSEGEVIALGGDAPHASLPGFITALKSRHPHASAVTYDPALKTVTATEAGVAVTYWMDAINLMAELTLARCARGYVMARELSPGPHAMSAYESVVQCVRRHA